MAAAILEAHHLVLDRRAVAGTDALDPARIHRRAIEILADHAMGLAGRSGQMTVDLGRDDPVRQEGKRCRRIITRLFGQTRPVDRPAIEPRRRPRLQPPEPEPCLVEPVRETERRRIPDTAGRDPALADMDHAPKERARGEHDTGRAIGLPVFGHDARDPATCHDQIVDPALDHVEAMQVQDLALHGHAVECPVGLGARTSHRRSLAPVEQAELNARRIRHPSHQPVKRIDLAHEMSLAQSADCRVAGHLANSRDLVGDENRARAMTGRRGRGLAAGMAAADHDHIICGFRHGSRLSVPAGELTALLLRNAERVKTHSDIAVNALHRRSTRRNVSHETSPPGIICQCRNPGR